MVYWTRASNREQSREFINRNSKNITNSLCISFRNQLFSVRNFTSKFTTWHEVVITRCSPVECNLTIRVRINSNEQHAKTVFIMRSFHLFFMRSISCTVFINVVIHFQECFLGFCLPTIVNCFTCVLAIMVVFPVTTSLSNAPVTS